MTTNRSFLMDSHLLSRQRDTGTSELWDCETVGQEAPNEWGHHTVGQRTRAIGTRLQPVIHSLQFVERRD